MTLRLRYAGTPIELTDVVSTALASEGWTPNLARLRTGWMGNRAPYEDTDEDFILNSYGGTGMSAATLLANLALVQDALDRVLLWWDDPNTYAPTTIELQVANAASPLLSALLVPREDQGLYPPQSYGDYAPMGWMDGGTLRLRHRGQWLAAATTATAAVSLNSGEKHLANWGATSYPHLNPMTLTWDLSPVVGAGTTNITKIGAGVCIYTNDENRIEPFNAVGLATTANFSSVLDSANRARGTNVLRFTAPNATTAYVTGIWSTGFPRTFLRSHVWATMRTITAGQSFLVRVVGQGQNGVLVYGPYTVVEFTDALPHVVDLGYVVGMTGLSLEVRGLTTASTLDVDTIVVCGADNRTEGAVAYATLDTLNNVVPAQTIDLVIDHRLLTARDPAVTIVGSLVGTALPLDYTGNATLMMTGTKVAAIWLCTVDNYWRAVTNNGTLLTSQLVATRNRAYVLPL